MTSTHSEPKPRTIIHMDMDCFYVAVERLDNPSLIGKAVIVGADPTGRGVVSACSYEARKFGIHSAMPIREAFGRCPKGIFLSGHMERYSEESEKIMAIVREFTDLVEPISVDEAFLDVTDCTRLFGNGEKIGRTLKNKIKDKLNLVASIGIAPCKFVAKIASDHGKPDGFVVIEQGEVLPFLHPLKVGKLWGVGKKTEEILLNLGIKTIGDMFKFPISLLESKLGRETARFLKELSAGIDPRSVETSSEAKSMSEERTFQEDVSDRELLRKKLLDMTDTVMARVRRHGLKCRTVCLNFRNTDFTRHSRRTTLETPFDTTNTALECVEKLFAKEDFYRKKVRLIGMGVANFGEEGSYEPEQIDLFEKKKEPDPKLKAIDKLRDEVSKRFGDEALKRGSLV